MKIGSCPTKESMRKVDRREFLKLTAAAAVTGPLIGAPAVVRGQPKVVKFASIEPYTGPLSLVGIQIIRGIEMAVDEINQKGGIKSLGGAKLEIVRFDNEGKPEIGVNAVERIAGQSEIVAILGSMQSSVVLVQTKIAEKHKVLNIVTAANAPEIMERGYKYVFRVAPVADRYAIDDFEMLASLRDSQSGKTVKTIAIMYEDTAYGQAQFKAYEKYVKKYPLEIVGSVSYSYQAADLRSQVVKAKASNPDCLIYVGYGPDGILITKAMYELDFNPPAVYGTNGAATPAFIKNLGKLAEGIFAINSWSPKIPGLGLVRGEAIMAEHRRRYKDEMGQLTPYGFTAVYVLKDALERAASLDREKLREAIARTNLPAREGPIMPLERVEFDERGENKHARTTPAQIQKGKYEVVWPPELATSRPVFPKPKWAI